MFSELELLAMTRIRAPFVSAEACVGCGICQYRCHTLYVVQQQLLDRSAIRVVAENEHRLESYPADPAELPRRIGAVTMLAPGP
jgi:ferredoxin